MNNYKQDFYNIFDVCFSARSFTGATCQIWLTLFKLNSNKNETSFFDQERVQIQEPSQNLLHPLTEWWSWHSKSLYYGKHTKCWKPFLEDIYQQVGVYQGIYFQLKYILLEILEINSDDSVHQQITWIWFSEFFTFLMGWGAGTKAFPL